MKWIRLFGVALLGYLLWKLDWQAVWKLLIGARLGWVFLAGFTSFAFIALKGVRWNILLRVQGIRYEWRRSLLVYLAGSFFSTVTPGRIGDFIKVTYLHRDMGIPNSIGIPSVVGDRFLDLATLLLVSGCLSFNGELPTIWRWSVAACAFTAVTCLGILASGSASRAILRLSTHVQRSRARHALVQLANIATGCSSLIRVRSLGAVAISLLAHSANYSAAIALAAGLGIELTASQCIYAISFSSLVALLPVSVSGIGTRDVAMVTVFAVWDLPGDQALGFSLAYLFTNLLFGNGPGAVVWLTMPLRNAGPDRQP